MKLRRDTLILKRGRGDEVHLLASDGVAEPDFGGMEHQAAALGAVEFVADDGTAQTVGVCTVDAQLVGATRPGIERYYMRTHELVICHRSFAVLQVYHLARTVHGVRTQW